MKTLYYISRMVFTLVYFIFLFFSGTVYAEYQEKRTKPDIVRKKIVRKPPVLPHNKVANKTIETAANIKKIRPVYDPRGKIDPFQPFMILNTINPFKPAPKFIDLSEFKLTGILTAQSGNRALVQEASGKGYVVAKGDYLGNRAIKIKIKEIYIDRILVKKKVRDDTNKGKFIILENELKLNKP